MPMRPGDAIPIAHPYRGPPPSGQLQAHTHPHAAPPPPPPMPVPHGPPAAPQSHVQSSPAPHPQQHPHWQAAMARTQAQLVPTPVLGRPSVAGAPGPQQQQQLQFARPSSMASHHGVYMVPRVPYPPPPHVVAAQQAMAAQQAKSVEYVVQQAPIHEGGGPSYTNALPALPHQSPQAHIATSGRPSQRHEVDAPHPTHLLSPTPEAGRSSSAPAPPPPTHAAPPIPPPPYVQYHRSTAPPTHSVQRVASTPDLPHTSPSATGTRTQSSATASSASPAPSGPAQVRLPVIHPSFFTSVREALVPLLKEYAHAIATPVVNLNKNMSSATRVINERVTELVDEVREVRKDGEVREKAVQDVVSRVGRVEEVLGSMEEDKKAVMEMLTRIDSNMAEVRARLDERDATPLENKRPEKEYVDTAVSAIPPDPGPVLRSSPVQDSETDVSTPAPPELSAGKLQSAGVFPVPSFEDLSRAMNSRPRLFQSSPFSYSPQRVEETRPTSSSSSEVEQLGPAHWTERPSQESTLRQASTLSSRYLLESMDSPLRNLSALSKPGPSSVSPERARQKQMHHAFSLPPIERVSTPRPSYIDRSRESSLVRDYLLAPTESSLTREVSVVGATGEALAPEGTASATAPAVLAEAQKEMSPLSDLTSVEESHGSPVFDAKTRAAHALWDSMTPAPASRELSPLTEISSPEAPVRVKVEKTAARGRKRKLEAMDGGAGVRRRLSAPAASRRTRAGSVGGRKRRKTELGRVKVEKEGKGRKGKGVVWPEVIEAGARQFVQCDGCHTWYHYACVAIEADDPRLEEDATFHCPKCIAFPENVIRRKPKHLEKEDRNVPAVCARPGCTNQAHQDEYFVERIIGRQLVPSVGAKTGDTYLWLVKWLGYHVSQASWTLEDDMGDVPELISEFEDAARAEAHDLDASNEVLLQEAVNGGWKKAA